MAKLRMEFEENVAVDSPDIKACPFCGNKELVVSLKSQYEEICEENGSSLIAIKCCKCHVEKKLYDIPDNNYWLGLGILIGEWNQRRCD